MLVVGKQLFAHKTVADFPDLLRHDALLVVNETAVLPARVQGHKIGSGGKIEGLFLEEDEYGNWLMMLKSNGKLRKGTELVIGCDITLTLIEKDDALWRCSCSDVHTASEILSRVGSTPLPPYIRSARGEQYIDDSVDRASYQTVFADTNQCQSVAAPTAGLHFDEPLLRKLALNGIERVAVTLHVGAGTFRTVETESVEDHPMHSEHWSVGAEVLNRIAKAKKDGRPIIAVGTTTVRTLESLPEMNTWPKSGRLTGDTRLLISPPYDFSLVDGLLTNFHLPNSTLLALVGALIGMDRLKAAYKEAIAGDYRFFSYGDAMYLPSEK